MTSGWAPSQESAVVSSRLKDNMRDAVRAPVELVRSRSTTFVVWTPAALGGGNHMYMWLYAWHESRQGRPTFVLEQPGMRAWIDEFPRLAEYTVTTEQVRFTWQRGVVWNQDYPGSAVMTEFVREVLLSSDSFASRLDDAATVLTEDTGVINVRRGDYYSNPDVAKNYAMDYDYLLDMIREQVVVPEHLTRLIVVSDDLEWCRAALPQAFPGIDFEFPEAGAFGGLAYLAQARHLILSNSTFSYWGGYLNETLHDDGSAIFVPRFHSRNSDGGFVWQQSPTWSVLENLEHELTRRLPAMHLPVAASKQELRRVVFLVNSMCRPNGVVASVYALACGFRDAGIDVALASMGDVDADFAAELKVPRLRPWVRFTTQTHGFEQSKGLLKLPRRVLTPLVERVDRSRVKKVVETLDESTLVIAAGMECLEYVGGATREAGIVATQVHLSYDALVPDQLDRLDRCRTLADVVTTLTSADADNVRERCGGIVTPIANACLVERRAPKSSAKRVVFIGRLAEEKQVDHAIRAFAKVAPAGWVFDIYGRGPVEAELRSLASSLQAEVRFQGVAEDVAGALGGAGVHILSSRIEGLPMSIVEASRLGVPTIAYECSPGVREAVSNYGLLVSPQDEEGLAEALYSLMADEDKRSALGELAWQDDRFDISTIVKEWERVWSATP